MTVINTNTAALRAQNGSRMANTALQTAMARLSSGKRINSASDDAAGLAISTSMTSQIKGMNQAIRNANDGISLAQTADGSLDEVTNMLQRIRELAVESASGTYSASDRDNLQAEVTQLTSQLSDSLGGATFNGVKLFNTSSSASKSVAIQIGSNSGDTVNVDLQGIDLSNVSTTLKVTGDTSVLTSYKGAVTTAKATYDADVSDYNAKQQAYATALSAGGDASTEYAAMNAAHDKIYGSGAATSTDPASTDYQGSKAALANAQTAYDTATTATNSDAVAAANSTMDTIDGMLNTVNNMRANLGAAESRLNSVVNTLTNNVTNLSDANSRISDADFSAETTNLAKAQILSQASTAMLAQANQSQQGVLKLLQ